MASGPEWGRMDVRSGSVMYWWDWEHCYPQRIFVTGLSNWEGNTYFLGCWGIKEVTDCVLYTMGFSKEAKGRQTLCIFTRGHPEGSCVLGHNSHLKWTSVSDCRCCQSRQNCKEANTSFCEDRAILCLCIKLHLPQFSTGCSSYDGSCPWEFYGSQHLV